MAQLSENAWVSDVGAYENRSYNLVSLVGYLLGVRREMYHRGTLFHLSSKSPTKIPRPEMDGIT